MKNIFIITFIIFSIIFIYSQENEYFLNLSKKELASLNDAITLIKLIYNEKDFNASYKININWAIEKKLLIFSIPINPDEINQILTRGEFAYLICKVFNTKGGLVNFKFITKYHAFKKCISTGILTPGRGQLDTFTGSELLDTFLYLYYYVIYNNINIKMDKLEFDLDYEYLPEWRKKLYIELDEQKAMYKELRQKKKEERDKKRNEILQKFRDSLKKGKLKEKFIDKENLTEPK